MCGILEYNASISNDVNMVSFGMVSGIYIYLHPDLHCNFLKHTVYASYAFQVHHIIQFKLHHLTVMTRLRNAIPLIGALYVLARIMIGQ